MAGQVFFFRLMLTSKVFIVAEIKAVPISPVFWEVLGFLYSATLRPTCNCRGNLAKKCFFFIRLLCGPFAIAEVILPKNVSSTI
jgi:hypothetical protein